MLRWHRILATLFFPLILYVVTMGVAIEVCDLGSLLTHAPATSPNMLMMRQHIFGTPNYSVVSAPDYANPALPADTDFTAAIARAAALGHGARPDESLRLVEIRGVGGVLAGHVAMGSEHLIFDLATGRRLPDDALPPGDPPRGARSPRSDFKFLHAFRFLPAPFLTLNALAGTTLSALMILGVAFYFRMLSVRARQNRARVFWSSGQRWRDLHRWVSVLAAIPVLWIALTGLLLSLDGLYPVIAHLGEPPPSRSVPSGFDGDFSSPMSDSELAPATTATLSAYHQQFPAQGVKVLRLRHFAGYSQGVVIGADADTGQYVYNVASGRRMSMTEPGYPDVRFPSGWEGHQLLKRLHRGDALGLYGRFIELFGGLGALFLLGSGVVMYRSLWLRRAANGRTGLLWK